MGVIEAAFGNVPTIGDRVVKELLGGGRNPIELAATQLPDLQQEPRPFQGMAGCSAIGPEHRAAGIVTVELPIGGEMLGDAPAILCRMAADDEIGDALGHAQIGAVMGRLEGGHQGLGQMHVGILAAILVIGLPVAGEFLGRGAMLLFPEALGEHGRDIGQQAIGIGMASQFGAGCRQQHESMAIGLLGVVCRAVLADPPEIAAMPGVAMALPEIPHAMIDHGIGAGPAEQIGNGEAMGHAGGGMQQAAGGCASRKSRWKRLAGIIQIEEATARIDTALLEEGEDVFGLLQQPIAVAGKAGPFLRRLLMRWCIRGGRCGHLSSSIDLRLVDDISRPVLVPRGGVAGRPSRDMKIASREAGFNDLLETNRMAKEWLSFCSMLLMITTPKLSTSRSPMVPL